MPRHTALLLALAALSATATASVAQSATPAGPGNAQDTTQTISQNSAGDNTQANNQMNGASMQSQPAPIERESGNDQGANDQGPNDQGSYNQGSYNQGPYNQGPYNRRPNNQTPNTYISDLHTGQMVAARNGTASAQPAPGIFLRVGQNSSVQVVAVGGENTELRVEHGIANIGIHQPVKNAHILVDLPGGQTSLIKDGFYTFNADTDTIRVLKGEAYAYPTKDASRKPIKVKENHAVIFNGREIKAFEFDPFEAHADLIPYGYGTSGPSPYGYYGYGPYGLADGGYPYNYWGYGYPYYFPFGFGWGWGWGWGGGWGGYYGGGWGGYRGGWGGGGFHGGGGFGGGGFHGGGGGGGGHR